MSFLVFDGDENVLSFFDANGQLIGSWPASNRGGPLSDHRTKPDEAYITFIPDGEYTFEPQSQHAPQKHPKKSQDTDDGSYGSLGILKLNDITLGGQVHRGLGVHAGHKAGKDWTVVSTTPLQQVRHGGPYYRTQGCVRTTEAAMHVLASSIVKDPLKILKVKNNGKHPMAKVSGSDARRN